MKKMTNWDLYYQKQMGDPEMRTLIEEELRALRGALGPAITEIDSLHLSGGRHLTASG